MNTYETLLNIGMPSRLRGFNYIVDVINLLDMPEWKYPKWTLLYAFVGTQNGVSGQMVEASIRHALKSVRNRNCNYDLINKYIGFTNCDNSSSLMLLYNRIKQDNKGVD